MGAVKCGSFDTHAMKRGLYDRVLFGMYRPAFLMVGTGCNVVLLSNTSNVQTVFHVAGCTVVSSGKDTFVANDHGPDLVAEAGGPFSNN